MTTESAPAETAATAQPDPAHAAQPMPIGDGDRIDLLDHGFVRLDASMADDLSVANAARVSFARRKEELDDADRGLIRFLMRDRHGTPFEHNSFRFHIRCPIFVAREWMRHRIGCLTGDTVVTMVESGEPVAMTIDNLWNGRSSIRDDRVRVLDESTNTFTSGRLVEIVDKGLQPVYRVNLADGKALTLTENHRILTDDGWRTMRDALALVGDGPGAWMSRTTRFVTNGLLAPEAPPLAEQARKLTGHPVEVVSVEYVGLRQTYDLCVDGPWHNFVANGVVVHNSFNEFSLRYAKATDDFYVPDLADVRTQVGKPGAYSFEPIEGELAEETLAELRKVYDVAYDTYTSLVEKGVARELARSVLPVGAYTEFYWTVNARSLMNFVSLRAAETAQREIRRYALAVEAFLAREMPVTYAAFLANNRTSP